MHDAEDHDAVLLKGEEDHIGESAQECAPYAWAHFSEGLRDSGHGGEAGITRPEEVRAKP